MLAPRPDGELHTLQRLFKQREDVPMATAIDVDAVDERLFRVCPGRQADALKFFQSVIPAHRANYRASYEPVRNLEFMGLFHSRMLCRADAKFITRLRVSNVTLVGLTL